MIKIIKIEECESLEDVYDIEVENDHNFIIKVGDADVTSHNCFVIADESQNTTPEQMRMIMTRLGQGSKMIIDGDVYQSDISGMNGLRYIIDKLEQKPIRDIDVVKFNKNDIIRNKLISDIEDMFINR